MRQGRGYRQANLFPQCLDCGGALRSNTAKRCAPCWHRWVRARVCLPCGGKKRPSRWACESCVADYAGWLDAWKRVMPEPKRPPGGAFSRRHLRALRSRASKRLPLFGGEAQEKEITIRTMLEMA